MIRIEIKNIEVDNRPRKAIDVIYQPFGCPDEKQKGVLTLVDENASMEDMAMIITASINSIIFSLIDDGRMAINDKD